MAKMELSGRTIAQITPESAEEMQEWMSEMLLNQERIAAVSGISTAYVTGSIYEWGTDPARSGGGETHMVSYTDRNKTSGTWVTDGVTAPNTVQPGDWDVDRKLRKVTIRVSGGLSDWVIGLQDKGNEEPKKETEMAFEADLVVELSLNKDDLEKFRRIVDAPDWRGLFTMYLLAKMVKAGEISPAMLGIKEDED